MKQTIITYDMCKQKGIHRKNMRTYGTHYKQIKHSALLLVKRLLGTVDSQSRIRDNIQG